MSINRVMISGNITYVPELRTTPSNTPILGFGVAVNDRRKDRDGNWTDYPNFVDCKIIAARAESLQKYLDKGMKVAIEGKLSYSSWEDRNTGQKRSKIEVVVDEIEFMSSNKPRQGEYQVESFDYGDTPPMLPRDAYADADIPF